MTFGKEIHRPCPHIKMCSGTGYCHNHIEYNFYDDGELTIDTIINDCDRLGNGMIDVRELSFAEKAKVNYEENNKMSIQ